jgi:transcriptional regulator with XRE-family HTH domain
MPKERMVFEMAQYKTRTLYSIQAGSFLRRMLKDNGYTQERFAEEFGVSTRHVRRWLHGGINSLDTVQQLLAFFDAEIGDVFDTEDVPGRFFAEQDVIRPCAPPFFVVKCRQTK